MVGAASHFPPNFFLHDEAGSDQTAQMEGQGRGRYVEARLDLPDIEALGRRADQQPKDIEPGQVAQLAQAPRSEVTIHAATLGSDRMNNNDKTSFMVISA
jgi:hypothetical protein